MTSLFLRCTTILGALFGPRTITPWYSRKTAHAGCLYNLYGSASFIAHIPRNSRFRHVYVLVLHAVDITRRILDRI